MIESGSSPINGPISVYLRASWSSLFDHSLTAIASLTPKLVIAIARHPALRRPIGQPSKFRVGWGALIIACAASFPFEQRGTRRPSVRWTRPGGRFFDLPDLRLAMIGTASEDSTTTRGDSDCKGLPDQVPNNSFVSVGESPSTNAPNSSSDILASFSGVSGFGGAAPPVESERAASEPALILAISATTLGAAADAARPPGAAAAGAAAPFVFAAGSAAGAAAAGR